MKSKKRLFIILFVLCAIANFPLFVFSKTNLSQSTPPELYQWKDWVLYDNEEALCPTRYNDKEAYICIWPTALDLVIEKESGTFSQKWTVHSETMVHLPGNSTAWPENVRVDGKQAPVFSRDNLPVVLLSQGTHTVTGNFKWLKMPLALSVPPSVGLVSLTLFGQKIDSPQINEKGMLWLQKEKSEKIKEDRYEASVYRLINDTIPMLVTTRLQIKVSGSVREIQFPGLLFENYIPVGINSELPVRVGEGGDITLQARPGTWDIRITARSSGPVYNLTLEDSLFDNEIWSFQAQNQLRMVKIEGAPSVDPSQTEIPAEWQRFPAYLLKEGERLLFEETRRGDPDPAPDKLNLHRTFWLDFDGKGLTIRDMVTGTMSRSWYLAINPPAELGRVSVDDQDMLITKQGPEEKPGVQLRRGDINLNAEMRYTTQTRELSAVSWDHDFQRVSGTLNLPPGWRLFSAAGIDSIPGTWILNWTLMDIFITLIISVSLLKLRNWKWGLISLITLCLIYQEPGAPRIIWLFIIAAMALSSVLPDGRLRRLSDIVCILAVVVLLVISIPFMVQQIRWGVFPQLEPVSYERYQSAGLPTVMTAKKERMKTDEAYEFELDEITAQSSRRIVQQKSAIEAFDPDVLVQTGPGVPDWQWRSYPLTWNGPVKSDQAIKLRLISPAFNLVLSILRVLMLSLLIFCVISAQALRNFAKSKKLAVGVLSAALISMISIPHLSVAADPLEAFPPQALLQELEKRLLEKHDCYPSCADILDLEIIAQKESLQLLLNINAAIDTAVPLPVTSTSWLPEEILLDGQEIKGLSRQNRGPLWALIPEGIHLLSISGSISAENDIQLPFVLKPHFAFFKSTEWDAVGINPDGSVGSSIQLTRLDKTDETGKTETFETSTIPAFLEAERVFHLGITWSVATTFNYRSQSQSPVVISYPLLSNEAVTTAGVDVKNGNAVITMAPNRPFTMESALEISPVIILNAPMNVPWTETWILDASPIWHCDLSGISVVHHQDSEGLWQPTWKPWPGESVTINVSRPEAIPGQSVTIDSATLQFTPGQRYDNAALRFDIRTSRGGQHEIELPESALLQQVKINGRTLPVQQDGRSISIPIQPGENGVSVEWQQATSSHVLTKSPEIKIGEKAVNTKVSFKMPRNRWILLTGGPQLGPAVLFWSYLVVVVLAAFGLKYVKFTPLKFWAWLLLGIGLTQVLPIQAIAVVAWFIALGWREKHYPEEKWFLFNLIQVGLFFLTIIAVVCLYSAVEQGLLGIPDMQISGNGSSNWTLNWTQDRVESYMPDAWAISVPVWVYHVLMLLWSLWLAFSLIKWLRWGWKCYGSGGFWKQRKKTDKKPEQPQGAV